MPDQSKTEPLASLQQRLQALLAALPDINAPAAPAKSPDRLSKPIALTLRLDPERYTRLCTHATRLTPRKSFQRLILEAIDGYLDV